MKWLLDTAEKLTLRCDNGMMFEETGWDIIELLLTLSIKLMAIKQEKVLIFMGVHAETLKSKVLTFQMVQQRKLHI